MMLRVRCSPRPRYLIPVVPLLALALASSAGADADFEEVVRCMERNLPPETSIQNVEFQSRDRAGGGRTLKGKVFWGRSDDGLSQVVVRLREPNDLKGAGLLLLEKSERAEMFVYLPDLQKVRRVTTRTLSGSLFGSDFTYEDFQQIQGMSLESRQERLPDTTLEGVPVHVLVQHPVSDSGSAYERIVSYIARDTCTPLKSEMWESGDRLRKVLTVDREAIHHEDGVRIPQQLLMEDLRNKTTTRLIVSEIEVGAKISKRVFTTSYLQRRAK